MQCGEFERVWIDAELEVARLPPEAQEHLKSCGACRARVEEEKYLLGALAKLNFTDGKDQKEQLLLFLDSQQRQRSYLAGLPIVSSGLLLLAGIVSWGGLPAGHIIADFPGHALGSGSELLSVIGETLEAGARAASAASRLLPSFLEVFAGLLTFCGLALSTGIYRRWKQRWTPHF